MQKPLLSKIKVNRDMEGEWLIGVNMQNIPYFSIVATQHKRRKRCVKCLLMRVKLRKYASPLTRGASGRAGAYWWWVRRVGAWGVYQWWVRHIGMGACNLADSSIGNYNIGQGIVNKFRKFSKICFSMECFFCWFLQLFLSKLHKCQNLLFW